MIIVKIKRLIIKKDAEVIPFWQISIDHDSFTLKISPPSLLISKLYFILALRINLLSLTEQVGLPCRKV